METQRHLREGGDNVGNEGVENIVWLTLCIIGRSGGKIKLRRWTKLQLIAKKSLPSFLSPSQFRYTYTSFKQQNLN